jgi:hypothetical protein
MARHHRQARETRALPRTHVRAAPQKCFARNRRSWVELCDASDGAAHWEIKSKKGRAAA